MHNPALTRARSVAVDRLPVHVVPLSETGLIPRATGGGRTREPAPRLHECRHLPPTNPTEATLLSIWINTHQAMFFSTGICASAVHRIADYLDERRGPDEVIPVAELAVACRHASAAYTSLPHLDRDLYEAYVRESMRLVHPGFSGVSNREAIAVEASLRRLKTAQAGLASADGALARSLEPALDAVYAADRFWWKHHGIAMARMVGHPVSLARLDYKEQLTHGSGDGSFDDYRSRVLRQTDALDDYDGYFAVERRADLTIDDYRRDLSAALARSAPYVDATGPLADYRRDGEASLFAVLDLAAAQGRKS
ncbi:MAG: hypothetical protein R2882_14015 [Gemmatimonadales bacterium]